MADQQQDLLDQTLQWMLDNLEGKLFKDNLLKVLEESYAIDDERLLEEV